MFEIGFSELVMVALVSLLVIGPERLPKAARLAGFWLGKTRAMISSVKSEIQMELRAEEMRQLFKDETGLNEFQQLVDETKESVNSIQSSLTSLSTDSITLEKTLPHEPE
jgi:sec-independent protein translocase protein TatB